MKNSFTFCLVYLTFSVYSCHGQLNKMPPPECIELNNRGNSYMMNATEDQKSGISKAIQLFTEAIRCDSTYLIAYINLAQAYDRNLDYKKELRINNRILELSHNDPSIIMEKAEIFEKMGVMDSANKFYKLAKQSFIDSLSIHPNNKNYLSGLILEIALTEGKVLALKELNKYTTQNPALKSDADRDFFENFDKRSYLFHSSQ